LGAEIALAMQNKFVLLLLFFFTGTALSSQSGLSLSGKIVDDSLVELPFVQVQLYHKSAGNYKLLTYSWADSSGHFQLFFQEPLVAGFLCFNAMGWQTDTFYLNELVSTSSFLGLIKLKGVSIQLDEVIIKEKSLSYYDRGDTTVFKPVFFQDGSERVLEDLLTKLPGVRVAEDGFLYFRGKRVSKVLWDGDDLLGNDYSKATKRLPAGMANEFRFVNKFEANPLLKSLNQSDQLVLDIEIKNTFKGKWIGDAFVGLGLAPMGMAGFSGYRIKKKIKFLSFAEANTFNDLSPGKKMIIDYSDDLNSAFQPMNLLSWFVFPSFFPVILSQSRFNQGKSINFAGGPHWKLGKGSYINMQVDGLLSTDYFQNSNFTNQLLSQRTWRQQWTQNDIVNRFNVNSDGRINLSGKSNISFRFNGVKEILTVSKMDSLSSNEFLPLTSTEGLLNERLLGDLHVDWILKPNNSMVWRVKSWSHFEKMQDTYDWQVDNRQSFNTQYVGQSNYFSRLQGLLIHPTYQWEIGSHVQQNHFNAYLQGEERALQKVNLLYHLIWIGGKREWIKKSHLLSVSGSGGPASFKYLRSFVETRKYAFLLEGNLRYKLGLSKKFTFESVLQLTPVLPDAGQIFKGQIRTGILQRETGMDELIVPRSTQFKNRLIYSDNKKQWESQASFTLNYKSPYLGNRTLSGIEPDWLIEKYAFRLSKGMIIQWNIDKYFIQQSASFGLNINASRQNFLFGLNQWVGENVFYHLSGKLDVRLKIGKLGMVLSPGIYHRQTSTDRGDLSVLTQFMSSGNLQWNIWKKSSVNISVEYLPGKLTGNKPWFWAKAEGKFPINEKYFLVLEVKNIFNQRNLTLGDLWADSQIIQQFQVNPLLVMVKIYKNF
jgi:hypothetical protein